MLRSTLRHVPRFVLLVAVSLLTASCGHKGELYLPGKKEKEQKNASLPLPGPSYDQDGRSTTAPPLPKSSQPEFQGNQPSA
ncbi:MAG: lipoprotein [Magnetococcales bacterium]|nr:lipoprotein [Magnetococcales bacterium]